MIRGENKKELEIREGGMMLANTLYCTYHRKK